MTTFTTQDRQDAQREPVAWYVRNRETGIGYLQTNKPTRMDKVANEYIPLYSTSTPIDEERLKQIWYDTKSIMGWYSFLECARAIERAHGIGE